MFFKKYAYGLSVVVFFGGSAQDDFTHIFMVTLMGLKYSYCCLNASHTKAILVEAMGRIYTLVKQAIIASDNGLSPDGIY